MDCPKCQIPLEVKEIGNIKLDECAQCQGMWFDQGEFRAAKDQADPDLNWLDFDIWKHEDQFQVAAHPLRCPTCRVEMYAVNYGHTGVEVDYCAVCQGLWLDGGEFSRIIEALEQELENKDVTDYVKASLKEAKDMITGPEKPASEWKDFTTVLRMLQYRIFSEKPRLLAELIDAQKGTPIW